MKFLNRYRVDYVLVEVNYSDVRAILGNLAHHSIDSSWPEEILSIEELRAFEDRHKVLAEEFDVDSTDQVILSERELVSLSIIIPAVVENVGTDMIFVKGIRGENAIEIANQIKKYLATPDDEMKIDEA